MTFRGLVVGTVLLASALPAVAQTSLQDMKDGVQMMVGVGAICSDYLKRPELLDEQQQRGLRRLVEAGLPEAEASALIDAAVTEARAEPSTEIQSQVACEMVGIKALPQ